MKKKNIFYIIFLLFSVSVFPQTFNIEHYTVRNGLLHSFVNDVIQDKRGNIWIATGGGLCKFDGVEFTNYTKKDGLNGYRLLSLAEDDFNNIWIGTQNGINVFNGDSIYALKSTAKRILAMAKSIDGQMWIASNTGIQKISFKDGIFYITGLNYDFGHINNSNIFQDRNRNSFLIETDNHQLYIGLNNSVYVYHNKMVKKLKKDKNVSVFSACKIENGKVIFGTNNGLYFDEKDSLISMKNKYLSNFNVFKIKYKNYKLWMIGNWNIQEKKDLFLVSISLKDKKHFIKISDRNGLIDNPTSLFVDQENNVWIGSNGGLSVLKGEEFVNYTTNDGLIGNKIWGVFQDSYHNIWVGTIGEGLSIMTSNNIIKFDTTSGLPCMYIASIFQVSASKFFLGTAHKGLCVVMYNPEFKSYTFSRPNISINQGTTRVDDILRDKNETLWVGSSKGLFYSNDNGITFIHKPLFEGDENQVFVQKLFEGKNGCLYIGTRQRGLFVINSGKIQHLLGKTEKLGISSICEDKEHHIWVSSLSKGILRIDNDNHWISERNGLKSNLIYILQTDRKGSIWIGSNLGLDRLNIERYDQTGEIDIRHYDTDDGLQALEMNLNGSIEDYEGNLWFATNNGILKYDYHYDISNSIPPIINLVNIKLHSTNVDWSKFSDSLTPWYKLPVNPILPYNDNHITFEFVGISFKNPKEIKYTWKLMGFDKKWVPTTYNRQVVYSNLSSGKYVFKLKASNNDGVWSKPLEFPFEILSPFWARWWFILLLIVVFILFIFLYVKLRTRSLINRQRELELQIKQRTEKILFQKEELESQIEIVSKQKYKIEIIHSQLSDSIEYAKRIQKAALPDRKSLQSLVSDAFVFFKPRDVVSGDFYWWTQMKLDNILIITVADCTGHGVPGAFMSLLGISFLREIVTKEYVSHPGVILRKLRKEIINFLKQKEEFGGQKDGMDMSLVSINLDTNKLQFAGANNPLYIITNYELSITNENSTAVKLFDDSKSKIQNSKLLYEIKPDKMPIAIYGRMDKFTNHNIQLQKGDQIYLFSDGFADQFGGPTSGGKKFKYKAFKHLLLENADKPMPEQKVILKKIFAEWKGTNEQVDDITILGIKI